VFIIKNLLRTSGMSRERYFLDENLPERLVPELRALGHDADKQVVPSQTAQAKGQRMTGPVTCAR
jgi:hypothetical protein